MWTWKKAAGDALLFQRTVLKKIKDYCAISGAERRFITAVELSDADGSITAIK